MNLPKPNTIKKAESQNPRKLFIFSHEKVGKTQLVTGLENHLLIDVEDGSNFIDGTVINVKEEANKEGIDILTALKQISTSIENANQVNKGKVYDYIIIDTATGLENYAKDLALKMYKATNMGKTFAGNDIYNLPNGAGYGWTREAFEIIYNSFAGLANKCLILLGHVKTASINKNGQDLSAKDINLTGKLKNIVAADSDAIGYLYRNKGSNQNILSFKTNEQDLATGARPPHLRNKEFLISELQEDNSLVTHWDQIFLS